MRLAAMWLTSCRAVLACRGTRWSRSSRVCYRARSTSSPQRGGCRPSARWRVFWASAVGVSVVNSATRRLHMSIIAWIVLGLIAGFIASKLVSGSGQGLLMDMVLGIVGAVVGGYLFTALGATGITGFNLYSMLVAIIGAAVLLVIYHAIAGRST